jgi:hypothetical protein
MSARLYRMETRVQERLFMAWIHRVTGIDVETWLEDNHWEEFQIGQHRFWKNAALTDERLVSLTGAIAIQASREALLERFREEAL